MKLPVTGKFKMESEEAQWQMLINGLINELKISAIVEIEPKKEIRIWLVIKTIICPTNSVGITHTHFHTNLGEQISNGLSRADEFFSDYTRKSMWIFIGYIEGKEKQPVLITHYHEINMTIYTQKVKEETLNSFAPFTCLN